MKPTDKLKLVSQLIDLPLLDKDRRWCGVVDDVEFDGGPGKPMRVKALLVGPGAYRGRVPGWMFWLVTKVAGSRISRVPFNQIDTIGSAVHLRCPAEKLGLHAVENRVRSWIPRKGAL
jgi:sporulation protein YlmC with PRC-barrel domain